jgi:hypothetical protein
MSHRRNAPNSGHWFSSYLKRNGLEAQSNMQDKFDVGGEEEENEKKRVEGEKKEGKKWDLGVWRCGLEGYEDTLPSDDKATETENSGDTGLPNSAGDDSGTLEGGGAKIVAEVKDENHKCEEGVMKSKSRHPLLHANSTNTAQCHRSSPSPYLPAASACKSPTKTSSTVCAPSTSPRPAHHLRPTSHTSSQSAPPSTPPSLLK